MLRTLGCLLVVTLCVACSPSQKSSDQDAHSNTQTGLASASSPTYAADIRWTSYGIPHVKADDWKGLGYGFAFATATDAFCVIAKDVAMVNSKMSTYFGASEKNLDSDIFHKSILTDTKLSTYRAAQSAQSGAFNAGYVAGYNRYLRDHQDKLPASCANQAWAASITIDDLHRLAIGVGIRYGLGRFQAEIANAGPNLDQPVATNTQWQLPIGIGSNAVAVGRDLTTSGRGILLGNPHYPWHGSSRFHLIHTTIPGELDVMGTSLLTTTRVSIGFNKDIAWTHTVSTALRFTLYQLQLNPENPMEYLYEGAHRPIEKRSVAIHQVDDNGVSKTIHRDVYFTHFGPMIENDQFPWSDKHAYTLRDAVLDNYLTADTYDALNKASSTSDIEAAISKQGVYWTNTVAADRHGNALYADISGTPNVDAALMDACRINVPGAPERLPVLNGTRASCEWKIDPQSLVPGALAAKDMPRITRQDYVTNSNDSYWLSNPNEPLEGYSPIIGPERTARSLRTRAGLTQMAEMIAQHKKLSPQNIKDMLFNHRNYAAELLLDDVLAVCENAADIKPACDALTKWDRTMTVTSQGGHLWREFWDNARNINDVFAVKFDKDDPVNTPAGINLANASVKTDIHNALLSAQIKLNDAGIALDAVLGDIQFAPRNGTNIPIPGGEGWAGQFSMTVSKLQPGQGYSPIVHGNSYIQVVSWDKDGTLNPSAMLTYSQSPEPESPHYSDLTEIYSQGGWVDLPFTDAEINADPNLRHLVLVE